MRLLLPVSEVRTGAAQGADTFAALVSRDAMPTAHHVVYVPAAPHSKQVVEMMESRNATIIRLPDDRTYSIAYRSRNEAMCKGASELVAFLHKPTYSPLGRVDDRQYRHQARRENQEVHNPRRTHLGSDCAPSCTNRTNTKHGPAMPA